MATLQAPSATPVAVHPGRPAPSAGVQPSGAAPAGAAQLGALAERSAGGEAVQALVSAPPRPEAGSDAVFPAPIPLLPVALGVAVPVRDFRVRQLLALEPGQVIETRWNPGDDLPLSAGEVQLGWSEFEVVESQLAVRLTRLA